MHIISNLKLAVFFSLLLLLFLQKVNKLNYLTKLFVISNEIGWIKRSPSKYLPTGLNKKYIFCEWRTVDCSTNIRGKIKIRVQNEERGVEIYKSVKK